MNNKGIVQHWAGQRLPLCELMSILPERGADWRPWDRARTTLELAQHIAMAGEFLLATAAGREMRSVRETHTLAQTGDLLRELFEVQSAEIASLSPETLSRVVTLRARNITESAADVLWHLVLHETHHKGQLWVYARMLGVAPPFFMN